MNKSTLKDINKATEFFGIILDHIKCPTDESTDIMAHTLGEIEHAFNILKSIKPRTVDDPPRSVGRPRNPNRKCYDEKGKYDTTMPEGYQKSYYETNIKGIKVACPGCGKEQLKPNMWKHQNNFKCEYMSNLKNV